MNIKPCPFCGSEAKLKAIPDHSDYCFEKSTGKLKEYYDIMCANPDCYLCDGADWNQSSPEAIIELWNKRDKRESRDRTLRELGI